MYFFAQEPIKKKNKKQNKTNVRPIMPIPKEKQYQIQQMFEKKWKKKNMIQEENL